MSHAIPEKIQRLLKFPAERSETGEVLRIDRYDWSISTDPSDYDFVIIAVEVRVPLSLREWFVLLLDPVATGRGDHIACDMDPIYRKGRLSARIREDAEESTKAQLAKAVHDRAQMLLHMIKHNDLRHERILLRRHARLSQELITCLNSATDPGEPTSQEDLFHLTERLMAAIPGAKVTELVLPMLASGMIDPVKLADIEHFLDLQTDTLLYGGGTPASLPVLAKSDRSAEEDGGTWAHRRDTTFVEIRRFWRYQDPQVELPLSLESVIQTSTPAANVDPRSDPSQTTADLPAGDRSTSDHASPSPIGSEFRLKSGNSANFPIIFSNRLPRF